MAAGDTRLVRILLVGDGEFYDRPGLLRVDRRAGTLRE